MEELLKELRESRDKLTHQDQAAKAALQQMQKEMGYRVEQVWLGLHKPQQFLFDRAHGYTTLFIWSDQITKMEIVSSNEF